MRYFVHLAYDGSAYRGWQVQPTGPTVQGRLNAALSRALCEHVSTDGCGRTDAGVHATDFYAQFSTAQVIPARFAERLNSLLPADISVFRVFRVRDQASARFSALRRTYQYYIHRQKNAFLRNYACQLLHPALDWAAVRAATPFLLTVTDFTALCRASDDFKTNLCQLFEARWDEVALPFAIGNSDHDTCMRFTITANRFLRGMVRMIVGALIAVGQGRLDPAVLMRAVREQRSLPFHLIAPPHGLYLAHVAYPDIEFREAHSAAVG